MFGDAGQSYRVFLYLCYFTPLAADKLAARPTVLVPSCQLSWPHERGTVSRAADLEQRPRPTADLSW